MRFLNRLFNVRPGEWSRLGLLYLMNFLVLVGLYWGDEIVEAAFLSQVGIRFLPLVMIGNAICSILAVLIYTAFADRVANDRLLIVLLGIGALGIAAGLWLLQKNLVQVAYPLLYLVIQVPLRTILNVHRATFNNSFYDVRSAKRIIPMLSSAVQLAGMVAGLSMPLLNRLFSPAGIVLIWLCATLAAAAIVWLMPRVLGRPKTPVETQATSKRKRGKHRSHWADNVGEGYHFVVQSPFLRWMAIATLLVMVLLQFVDYQTKSILSGLGSVQQISNFTGALRGWSNLIALPFQLFFLGRIIGWTGLGSAALLFPFSTLLTCLGLVFVPGLPSAALGQLDRTTLLTSLRNSLDSLLYNAVPARVKGRARAFIGGVVGPFGALLGGMALLLLKSSVRLPLWFFPSLIAGLAVAYLISSWIVRQQYARALIVMLEGEDFSFLFSQEASGLFIADPTTLNLLRERLEQPGAQPEFVIFMAQLIAQAGGRQVSPVLEGFIRNAVDPYVKASVVDILSAVQIGASEPAAPMGFLAAGTAAVGTAAAGTAAVSTAAVSTTAVNLAANDSIRRLYVDLLSDADSRVRQSALAGLERLTGPGDRQFEAQALALLDDPSVQVRMQALLALAASGHFDAFDAARRVLDQLLGSAEPSERACGVRVLGKICRADGRGQAFAWLVQSLSDSADQVRLQAVLAVETLPQVDLRPQTDLRPQANVWPLPSSLVRELLRDPLEPVRQSVVDILSRINTAPAWEGLAMALADPAPLVCATAADMLVRVGPPAAPLIKPLLETHDLRLGRIAASILTRVDAREYGELARRSIDDSLAGIYDNYGQLAALAPLSGYSGIAAMQNALRDQSEQLLDGIFELLGVIYPSSDVSVIVESLRHPELHMRAAAVEALESLATPQMTRLIIPLLDPSLSVEELFVLGQGAWGIERPSVAQVLGQLAAEPGEPWLRAVTAFALGEIGVVLTMSREVVAQIDLTRSQIEEMIDALCADEDAGVRRAAQAAQAAMNSRVIVGWRRREGFLLSAIEKIIFLKKVPLFEGLTIEQLNALASVCEEELIRADTRIFEQGDPGGALYVVVNGRVEIEHRSQPQSAAVRLATMEAFACFGEMSLFDRGPRSAAAVAVRDTLVLKLRREPLLALLLRHPDMAVRVINVLSQRLRTADERIAQLSRPKSIA